MKKVGIKIKSYTGSVSIVNQNGEGLALRVILGALGLVALSYVAVLGNTVLNVVAFRSAESEIRSLVAETSALELKYLEKLSSIDMELSRSLGFEEVKASFAVRQPLGLSLGQSRGNINLAQNGI